MSKTENKGQKNCLKKQEKNLEMSSYLPALLRLGT